MPIDTTPESRYRLLKRLEKGQNLLNKKKIPAQEIAHRMGVTPGFLSRYRKPDLYNLSENSYEGVFSVMDDLLQENFNLKWNPDTEEYEFKPEPRPPDELDELEPNLAGLRGFWSGALCNKERTQKTVERETTGDTNFLDFFKLSITGDGEVTCYTHKNILSGKLSSVTDKTIAIELKAKKRRMTLYGHISLMDDLSKLTGITLAYIDTGDQHIFAGLAILNKKEQEELLEPGTYPIGIIEMSDEEKKHLIGKQILVEEYDFE